MLEQASIWYEGRNAIVFTLPPPKKKKQVGPKFAHGKSPLSNIVGRQKKTLRKAWQCPRNHKKDITHVL
jgi:hypothetical protein